MTVRSRVWGYDSDSRPPGVPAAAVTGHRAAVLAAFIELPHPTVRSVADLTGLSIAKTYGILKWWRDQGYVAWEPGAAGAGTMRATFGIAIPRPKEQV